MPFQKGVSGNPLGKPKGMLGRPKEFKEFCKAHGVEKAQVLVDKFDSYEPALQIKVVELLLDRGFGKPAQQHVLEVVRKWEQTFSKVADAIDATVRADFGDAIADRLLTAIATELGEGEAVVEGAERKAFPVPE